MRCVLFAALVVFSPIALGAPCAGFTDVEDTSPFCSNVAWLKNQGITLGCTTTSYCPDANVTRLQMAAFMARMGAALPPPAQMVPKGNVVTTHNVGGGLTRAVVGPDGLPGIFRLGTGNALVFHKCTTADCTAVGSVTISTQANTAVTQAMDATIGADGFPMVAYASSAGGLRVTKCSDAACTGTRTTFNVDLLSPASMVSLAIGPTGNPALAYLSSTGNYIVVRCADASCSTLVSNAAIASPGGATLSAPNALTLVIAPDGLPMVSIAVPGYGTLTVKCATASCGGTVFQVGPPLEISRLLIGTSGLPVIVGIDTGAFMLQVAQCTTASCLPSPAMTSTTGMPFPALRATMSRTGRLAVATTNGVIVCGTATCAYTWHGVSDPSLGAPGDIVTMPDGSPFAVFSADNAAFSTVRCGNEFCSDYWARR